MSSVCKQRLWRNEVHFREALLSLTVVLFTRERCDRPSLARARDWFRYAKLKSTGCFGGAGVSPEDAAARMTAGDQVTLRANFDMLSEHLSNFLGLVQLEVQFPEMEPLITIINLSRDDVMEVL